MSLITETFEEFHSWATHNQIDYAVLRNYESLPDVGNDLDLAMNESGVRKFRQATKEGLFKKWDYITEVTTHNSATARLNIFIFRFYSLTTTDFVQFDFFQGFSMLGQPFFNISDLLTNRRKINSYYVVSRDVENLIKYFQVYNAIRFSQHERLDKYAALLMCNGESNYLSRLSIDYKYLQKLLSEKQYVRYVKYLSTVRKRFLFDIIRSAPAMFFKGIIGKLKYLLRIYVTEPFSSTIQLSDKTEASLLENELDQMVENKVIRTYLIHNEKFEFSIVNIKRWLDIRSHGGIIVKYHNKGKYVTTTENVKELLYDSLISGEKICYKRC